MLLSSRRAEQVQAALRGGCQDEDDGYTVASKNRYSGQFGDGDVPPEGRSCYNKETIRVAREHAVFTARPVVVGLRGLRQVGATRGGSKR